MNKKTYNMYLKACLKNNIDSTNINKKNYICWLENKVMELSDFIDLVYNKLSNFPKV